MTLNYPVIDSHMTMKASWALEEEDGMILQQQRDCVFSVWHKRISFITTSDEPLKAPAVVDGPGSSAWTWIQRMRLVNKPGGKTRENAPKTVVTQCQLVPKNQIHLKSQR